MTNDIQYFPPGFTTTSGNNWKLNSQNIPWKDANIVVTSSGTTVDYSQQQMQALQKQLEEVTKNFDDMARLRERIQKRQEEVGVLDEHGIRMAVENVIENIEEILQISTNDDEQRHISDVLHYLREIQISMDRAGW